MANKSIPSSARGFLQNRFKGECEVNNAQLKTNIEIAKKFYDIGLRDAECGIAFYKSEKEIEEICNKLT